MRDEKQKYRNFTTQTISGKRYPVYISLYVGIHIHTHTHILYEEFIFKK